MTEADTFSPVATSRRLVREARTAALSSIARRTGHPFGSLVTVACEPDGSPILLMSTLAAHSRNLAEDPRASLLFVEGTLGDPQQGGRVTLVGAVERIVDDAAQRRRYLTRNPDAALYAGFGDFAFFRLELDDCHLVAGFGRAMRVRREDFLVDCADATALVAAESRLVAGFTETPARVAGWAAKLGAPAGDWTVVGIDPEGIDLATTADEGRAFRRLVLPHPVRSPDALEEALRSWE
ncbi:HugZ family pyridoxamine 5'-phosphate oxidase [Pinisolibacter sp.]|uniref:HugZ family pyridoxamine 5'-phosphate oxidase n=1 Tax=Pinisolibacter sp. TaxID=2172024 RepID=UPI002FDE0BA4